MLKKTSFYVTTLVIGLGLIIASFAFREEEVKAIAGVLIGIGAGLTGLSISNLIMKRYEQKNPDIKKQNQIEFKDERNQMIRNRAKARSGDILQWLIVGLVYIMILFDVSIWLTVIGVAIFLSYSILSIYYMGKYRKEM